jgi:hypothetical protein
VETIGIFCIRLLEVLFFAGLGGCAAVVILSWISIFESGFSHKNDVKVFDEAARTPGSHRFKQPDLLETKSF